MHQTDSQSNPITYFNALHSLAELSGCEEKTSEFVANTLHSLGIDYQDHVGGYGVVGTIDSGKPGPTVIFRADMDALPYPNSEGKIVAIHACGHDAHCSMLLAAAAQMRDIVKRGKLKLVFQPGEENLTGALAMIKDGVLKDVDIAVGAHIRPLQELSPGMMSAAVTHVACATVKVRFEGTTAHASRPQQGVNSIDMAAQYITMVNSIHLDPNQSWSTKPTRIFGEPGATNNTCAWTEVIFDLRAATNPLLTRMINTMNTMAQSTALAYGGKVIWTQLDYCPASDYDPELVKLIEQCINEEIGADRLAPAPGGGGEDFHFFKISRPAIRTAYFGVGVGAQPGLHKCDMHFQTAYMRNGVKVWVALARKLMG